MYFLSKLIKLSIAACQNNRNLFAYVAIAFNKVDPVRLQEVGANRLCAEWVLKNSGAVSFTNFPGKFLTDYNSLPPENIKFYIQAIDATNSSIMGIGFEHLINCKHIDTIVLNQCKHLENDGLKGLIYAKDNLEFLEISNCSNINDDGLLDLKVLKNLKILKIFDMDFVQNINNVASVIRNSIPGCKIILSKERVRK